MDVEKFKKAIQDSSSFRDLGRRCGLSNHKAKKIANELKLDTSHFKFGKISINRIGETFNYLTIQKVYKSSNGRWMCECFCKCGNQSYKRLDGVVDGRVISCGCAIRNRPSMIGANNPAFSGCGELSGSRVYWIKRGAERRCLEFKISKKYMWKMFEKQNRSCAISGIVLKFDDKNKNENTASLDRIDSSKGYIKNNVQWVHKDINKIKQDMNQEYFIQLCKIIASYNS